MTIRFIHLASIVCCMLPNIQPILEEKIIIGDRTIPILIFQKQNYIHVIISDLGSIGSIVEVDKDTLTTLFGARNDEYELLASILRKTISKISNTITNLTLYISLSKEIQNCDSSIKIIVESISNSLNTNSLAY